MDQVENSEKKPKTLFTNIVQPKSTKQPVKESKEKCQWKGCRYSFSSDQLSLHESCHLPENDKGFKCFKCDDDEVFENWTSCSSHLWSKHKVDVGLFQCPICKDYRTPTQSKLDVHVQIHSEDKQFGCSVCRKRFRQLSQLKNHSVIHVAKTALPFWYTKKQCEICERYFSDSKCLKKHIQAVHSKLKPYICHVCNHTSARKAMLELHMRQHTGEKPFECDSCPYKTGDHNSLRRHKMRHDGNKPYKCKLCDYSTVQSHVYMSHVQNKHPGHDSSATGVYPCPKCPFKTVKVESYFGHLKRHESQPNEEAEDQSKAPAPEETEAVKEEPKSNVRKIGTKAKLSKRERKIPSKKKKKDDNRSTVTSVPPEDEDSLHAAPTDHGGTTIIEIQ